MTNDEMTTYDLVNALPLATVEVDIYGVAHYRTPHPEVAVTLEHEIRLLGFSVTKLSPSKTWHKQWAVVAWGKVLL